MFKKKNKPNQLNEIIATLLTMINKAEKGYNKKELLLEYKILKNDELLKKCLLVTKLNKEFMEVISGRKK